MNIFNRDKKFKIALVHDYLNQSGGAEIVLRWLHHLFPHAPVYTLIYDPELVPPDFVGWDIRTVGWSRYLPFKRKLYKYYLLLYPSMVEQIDLREYDIVISSSHLWAKGVLTRSDTLHICYCHTPMRQAWELYFEYKRKYSRIPAKLIYPFAFNYLRIWDKVSADRVDRYIANSETVRRRIKKFYRRDATVIYPPAEIADIVPTPDVGDYYLCLSRLVPYKRIDIAIEAFNRLGRQLVVVGTGPQLKQFRKMAKSNVKIMGFVSDEKKRELLSHTKALIFPGEEDFGIVPIEAQASGRPVIAYGKGGATETVLDGITGIFFKEPSSEALIDAIVRFEQMQFDPQLAVKNARRFSVQNFLDNIKDTLSLFVSEYFGEEYIARLHNTMTHKE
ncbi:glycosyltransferase [bacterium]|nr:glycosyltransferase [bacterium]